MVKSQSPVPGVLCALTSSCFSVERDGEAASHFKTVLSFSSIDSGWLSTKNYWVGARIGLMDTLGSQL